MPHRRRRDTDVRQVAPRGGPNSLYSGHVTASTAGTAHQVQPRIAVPRPRFAAHGLQAASSVESTASQRRRSAAWPELRRIQIRRRCVLDCRRCARGTVHGSRPRPGLQSRRIELDGGWPASPATVVRGRTVRAGRCRQAYLRPRRSTPGPAQARFASQPIELYPPSCCQVLFTASWRVKRRDEIEAYRRA